ncbi:MAG: hypothetical protein ACTHON_19225, partial [Humibacter sp.]
IPRRPLAPASATGAWRGRRDASPSAPQAAESARRPQGDEQPAQQNLGAAGQSTGKAVQPDGKNGEKPAPTRVGRR